MKPTDLSIYIYMMPICLFAIGIMAIFVLQRFHLKNLVEFNGNKKDIPSFNFNIAITIVAALTLFTFLAALLFSNERHKRDTNAASCSHILIELQEAKTQLNACNGANAQIKAQLYDMTNTLN